MDSHKFVPAPPKLFVRKKPRRILRPIREVGRIIGHPDIEEMSFEQQIKKLGLAGSRTGISTSAFRDSVGQLARRHKDATLGINPKYLLHALDSGEIENCAKEVYGIETKKSKVAIDPELTTIAFQEMFEKLLEASLGGAKIIFASSRPASTMPLFIDLASLCSNAGAEILDSFSNTSSFIVDGRKDRQLTWVSSVGVVTHEGSLLSTNDANIADELIFHLPRPDLVVADHVFAGAALTNGFPTIALAGLESLAVAVASLPEQNCLAVPVAIDKPCNNYCIITNQAKSLFDSHI